MREWFCWVCNWYTTFRPVSLSVIIWMWRWMWVLHLSCGREMHTCTHNILNAYRAMRICTFYLFKLIMCFFLAGGGGAFAVWVVWGDEEESGSGTSYHFRWEERRERGEDWDHNECNNVINTQVWLIMNEQNHSIFKYIQVWGRDKRVIGFVCRM